ncbi:hypothetical protein Pyn_14199 [Prunus yedoensis var. nudiflora]|uniref:Uncharacterized protein n=1 Tax=Prunus yedoensis var. nudiflora TaxID=2094558 RepID=A0A314UKV7_PRUYE|nr:hypothetical protein Pyn_14199 [Prunus yedoensis var. nudiflora]
MDESSNWGTDTLTQRVRTKNQDPYAWNSPTRADYPIKGLQRHPVKVCPGFRHIHVSISTVSMYQYPRGGTYDDAHHVHGKMSRPDSPGTILSALGPLFALTVLFMGAHEQLPSGSPILGLLWLPTRLTSEFL